MSDEACGCIATGGKIDPLLEEVHWNHLQLAPMRVPGKENAPGQKAGGKYTGRLHVWETRGPEAPFQLDELEHWRQSRRIW